MNCIYFRIRTKNYNKYCYCALHNNTINFNDCKNCKNKEYKNLKKMKNRTSKQAKRERERFSIIYSDLSKCCECNSKNNIEKNEVFEGAYRQTSIRLGMVAPFCKKHHTQFHNDYSFNLKYKALFQKEFMKTESLKKFISIFKQDYIYLYKKYCNTNRNI